MRTICVVVLSLCVILYSAAFSAALPEALLAPDGVRAAMTRTPEDGALVQPDAVFQLPAHAFQPITLDALHPETLDHPVWVKLDIPAAWRTGLPLWLTWWGRPGAALDVYTPRATGWRHLRTGPTRALALSPHGDRPLLLWVAPARGPTHLTLTDGDQAHPPTAARLGFFVRGLVGGLLLAVLGLAVTAHHALRVTDVAAITALLAATLTAAFVNNWLAWLWLTPLAPFYAPLEHLAALAFYLSAAWALATLDPSAAWPRRRAPWSRATGAAGVLLIAAGFPHAALTLAALLWLARSAGALRSRRLAAALPRALIVGHLPGGLGLYTFCCNYPGAHPLLADLWQVTLLGLLVALGAVLLQRLRVLSRRPAPTGTGDPARPPPPPLTAQINARSGALNHALGLMQAALRREITAGERRQAFLRSVVHDLRTPLAVMLSTVDNLECGCDATTPPLVRSDYAKLQRAGQRLAATLEQHLSRDSGALAAGPAPVVKPYDLAALVHDTVAAAEVLAQDHTFTIDLQALPAQFLCDVEMTRIALRNLVDNAVKYSPPGARVTIRGGRVGRLASDAVWLAVSDTGPGLPAAALSQLFDPYFRGPNSAGQPGQGLGLPLARQMIEEQGGLLTASALPDRGLTFTLWLPNPLALTAVAPRLADPATMATPVPELART